MIIKVIPENEDEKKRLKKSEYYNVTEFFLFGNQRDEEGQLKDFHNWLGNHRYLLGSLTYFYDVINDERRRRNVGPMPEVSKVEEGGDENRVEGMVKEFKMHKTGAPIDFSKVQVIEMDNKGEKLVEEKLVEEKLPTPGFELVKRQEE